jgi:hypothetical protein
VTQRRRWLRLLIIAVSAIVLVVILLPTLLGAGMMWTLTHPGCGDDGAKPNLPYREISIPAHAGGVYRGYFIAGTKDATIIVPPPYNSGRGGMLHEAALLAADGFNVLTFESRVCAGKSSLSLGYSEVDDVGDVLAYLRQNADNITVNMDKIALHGFSSAGATSTMAAARYPEIHALLAEGGYHDMDSYVGISQATGIMDSLIVFGARTAYHIATGLDVTVLSPLDAITHIPPRPIFLVYGKVEPSLSGARQQLAAVRAMNPQTFIQLWEVPGAGHGGYLSSVGADEYKRHVLPFYNCALLDQCDDWQALWNQP